MKRSYKEVEPSYRSVATLSWEECDSVTLPCQLWLPRHNNERPYFRFESTDILHRQILGNSPVYNIRIEFVDLAGETTSITGFGMFLQDFEISFLSSDNSSFTSFGGEADELFLVEEMLDCFSGSRFEFFLGDNVLLEPKKWRVTHRNGNVEIRGHDPHVQNINTLGEVTFEKRYYEIEQPDGAIATYSKLVATFDNQKEMNSSLKISKEIFPFLDDYLLLCSFAANQRTQIFGWEIYSSGKVFKAWYGNLSDQGVITKDKHDLRSSVLQMRDFSNFIKQASESFTNLSKPEQKIVRQAIHRTQPAPHRTVESAILSFFSAIESLILLFRKQKKLEFTVPKSTHWKKLEKKIKLIIHENSEYFPSDEHLDSLIKMLPSLRRVPLDIVYSKCLLERNIDLSDLWPVFAEGASLSKIRNRLVHGEKFEEAEHDALFIAMDHLEIIAKRIILSFLEWPTDSSNISPSYLSTNGWSSYHNLNEIMSRVGRCDPPE
ncbi:hypothetical protein [Pseudomonas chlororaphis]